MSADLKLSTAIYDRYEPETVARKDLPLSTYTEAYWKIDLHNLFHFLGLRMEPHAQKEIREYAAIIGEEIVSKVTPIAYKAFKEYGLNSTRLSELDIAGLKRYIKGEDAQTIAEEIFANKRERDEFLVKLEKFKD